MQQGNERQAAFTVCDQRMSANRTCETPASRRPSHYGLAVLRQLRQHAIHKLQAMDTSEQRSSGILPSGELIKLEAHGDSRSNTSARTGSRTGCKIVGGTFRRTARLAVGSRRNLGGYPHQL